MTADTEMVDTGRGEEAVSCHPLAVSPCHINAGVAQRKEALVLETRQCGFESLRRYQIQLRNVNFGLRIYKLRSASSQFRNPQFEFLLARVAQLEEAADLRSVF
jgi:hypothetical protein